MDNNTNITADDLTISDAAKIVAIEVAKSVAVATVQTVAIYGTLGVIGMAVKKVQDRKAAKKTAVTIETTPEND